MNELRIDPIVPIGFIVRVIHCFGKRRLE
jgi:hypothetical protein